MLQSIAAMVRDLAIDPALLFAEKPELAPLPEIILPGQWIPAHETLVLAVMNGGQAAQAEGETAGLIQPCAPGGLCDPQAMATSGPIPGPVRGTPSEQLFGMASLGARCNCNGGGGGCICPDDGFNCTVETCVGTICTRPTLECEAPDACTTGHCDTQTDACATSFCGDGECCIGEENNFCCFNSGETCCEFKYPEPCCPPETPACCGTFCCESEEQCCGTNCCEPEDCCNGDCKESCYDVVCGPDGWHPGPLCGETWCDFGQICCHGECCGDGPCSLPKCYPNGLCLNYSRCDDGNECTDDPCTPGQCAEYTCETPTNVPDESTCEDDGDNCTRDICSVGVCEHPPKCVGELTAQSTADLICCPDGHCCLADETCCAEGCCGSGNYCCSDLSGCCPNGFECCEENCCGGSAVCCNEACESSDCDLSSGSGTVCPGHAVDVDVVATCQPSCSTMTMTAEVVESEYQQYATVSVSPPSVACGPVKHPVTLTIALLPDTPLGTIHVDITGQITNSEGVVACEVVTTSTILIDLGAVLTISPGTIPATTAWLGMPPNVNRSVITVNWNPPDCEGRLEISELQPEDSYVPSDEGTLTMVDANTWHYDAFIEPQSEHCPAPVRVWIAAMSGDAELDRRYVRVIPVHTYLTWGDGRNFPMDFSFITWKYASVLATTGGAFTGGVTFSPDPKVWCGGIFGKYGYACTNVATRAVAFGTATFTGTENQAASIIGHELIHASGVFSECTAYTWEFTNNAATGIFQCDSAYLGEMVQQLNCECNSICP